MDALRLELGPTFQFVPNPIMLRRQQITGPDGASIYVYFRRGQRRIDPAIDGDFCLTQDDTGLQFPVNAPPTGAAKPVAKAVLDARTVVVKPWWLYADYRAATPTDLTAPDWSKRFPGFVPVPALASSSRTARRRRAPCASAAKRRRAPRPARSTHRAERRRRRAIRRRLVGSRSRPATPHSRATAKGRAVSCLSGTGFQNSVDCGCGTGLERCMPGAGPQNEPPAFVMPVHTPLGAALPFDATPQPPASWTRLWWSEEARHFLDRIFDGDRDVREVLVSRALDAGQRPARAVLPIDGRRDVLRR